MRRQHPSNHALKLTLAALALLGLTAVACNGDNSSPANGSPSPASGSPSPATSPVATPPGGFTPGTGYSPIQAVGTLLQLEGLEGHQIDASRLADCPVEEIIGTPDLVGRFAVAQFCMIVKDLVPDESVTIILDLPDTGDTWDVRLEYDADTLLWEIKTLEKISE